MIFQTMADNDVHNVVPEGQGYLRYLRYPHQFPRQDEGPGQGTEVTNRGYLRCEKPQLRGTEVTNRGYLRVPWRPHWNP